MINNLEEDEAVDFLNCALEEDKCNVFKDYIKDRVPFIDLTLDDNNNFLLKVNSKISNLSGNIYTYRIGIIGYSFFDDFYPGELFYFLKHSSCANCKFQLIENELELDQIILLVDTEGLERGDELTINMQQLSAEYGIGIHTSKFL